MVSQDPEEGVYKFKLESIQVSDFWIVTRTVDPQVAEMKLGYDFALDEDHNRVICGLNIRCELPNDNNPNEEMDVIMDIGINYLFKVPDLKKHIAITDNKKHLPPHILLNLLSVAYSTARGIIHERTLGYGLNALPLGVINMAELIKPYSENPSLHKPEDRSSAKPS